MKKLSLFLVSLTMILFSCKPEIEKPTVVTKSVGEVTKTSAKVIGQVAADGGAEVTERGVCWNTDGSPEVIDYRTVDGKGIGTYESDMTNLKDNTTYYVRAYATNEKGVSYGEEMALTTLKEIELPTVTTANVKDITESEAVSGGEVVSDGGGEVTARGICWSTSQTPTIEDNKTTNGSGLGSFTSNLSNLASQTTYYVRAYATNEKGTAYGEEVSFTTEEEEEPGDDPEKPVGPVVITAEVTEITLYSAKCGGEVSDGGGAVVVERGVCWNTSGNPTVLDFTTKDGSGLGSYISSITGLEYGTTYYVRAYAANANGVAGYGKEVSFTTLDKLLPTVTTTAEVTDITVSSATCGGEVTFEGNVSVTARGICWNTTGNPTIEDSKTTNGEGVGSFTSQIPNLVPNTQYYVRAYATNEVGTAYGEEVTFTTLEKLLPTVTTAEVTGITCYTAVSGGEVTFDGNVSVTARGICWSTSPNPTIEDNKTTDGSGVGSFTSNLSQLASQTAQTTYYVRAYATNEVGTAYGEERIFTTLPIEGTTNGHAWVDLGLPSGKKWATCNVGATSPEECGDYYAWGETTTKGDYFAGNSLTYGKDMNDISGNVQYDAATANWGGGWRMPTKAEQQELLDNCTWTWIKEGGINGYKVTGANGKSIFLPAAGYHEGASIFATGVYGHYWASTPYEYDENNAYSINFDSSDIDVHCNYTYRYYGWPVRPVVE